MPPDQPSLRSVLELLTKSRLVEVGRDFGLSIAAGAAKGEQVEALLSSEQIGFAALLRSLGREELRAACRAHGLAAEGRARGELMARLLDAHGIENELPVRASGAGAALLYRPQPGALAQVRHRQYLVESVDAPPAPGEATRVGLVCLDDDDQGRRLEVLWELELGARILPEAHGLGAVERLDPPRHFAAYLHALRWNSVTATEAQLFQAPFRAGIKLIDHQLTPLKKALELPRANLFIADDVGLGKTIEAGLVLQELVLRQRVDFVLVLCPATLTLQWRDEMERRFGLHFELYNRAFVARRRQERGMGVNPWTTHNHFVISYQTLRRLEYRDPLLQRLGERTAKSLLILDEAHTAAPAAASKYAVDSRITRMVREVAPRFENRLFLSATPHNGHSNSFSALLELLDPQRFTRGVKVQGRQLERVMVRRLKSDLRALGVQGFPERRLVQIELMNQGGDWQAQDIQEPPASAPEIPRRLGAGDPVEIVLSRLLVEYTELLCPRRGNGRLVFLTLQKRLLSSIEAFHRTLQLHSREVQREGVRLGELPGLGSTFAAAPALEGDDDPDDEVADGEDDDQPDEADEAALNAAAAAASRLLAAPGERARQVLAEMLGLAERHRSGADAKVLALLDWIRRHQCPAVQPGGTRGTAQAKSWSARRVIVFTEYGDTKRYLRRLLATAIDGTDDADQRILEFHGGMSDERRDAVQRAWNAPPEEHPGRILLATDAAREGVNLQGHCADLFHFDVPWNPARLEQRNGRIDRTLQPAAEVRCHYFLYKQRPEDHVLRILIAKVDRIRRELGSLSAVLMDGFAAALDEGIGSGTAAAFDAVEQQGRPDVVAEEVEVERADLARLRREIEESGRILNASRKLLDFDPALLRQVVDIGLEMAGAGRLQAAQPPADSDDPTVEVYELPHLPASWQATLDALRPPRRRSEPLWEWRLRPPQPVVFRPLSRLGGDRVHLHLQHPLVQRILSRFLARGFSAHDLCRVTVLRNPHDALIRVLAFGRLSLFGPGAVRLHDQLVPVAARWLESGGPGHLEPFAAATDREALTLLDRLLRELPRDDGNLFADLPAPVCERFRAAAPGDFATLWTHLRDEADHLIHDATRKLGARAEEEAEALRKILTAQRAAIRRTLDDQAQILMDFGETERDQRRQLEDDRKHMAERLAAIDREIVTEPAQIRETYRVALSRLQPVGLVYLWPESRG